MVDQPQPPSPPEAPPKRKKHGGRKKGIPNKVSQRAILAAKAGGIMPLDFLLSVMRNSKVPRPERVDAARAAAPYCHNRLAMVTHKGLNLHELFAGMTQDEFAVLATAIQRIQPNRLDSGGTGGADTTRH
jgi:hypothetical protein